MIPDWMTSAPRPFERSWLLIEGRCSQGFTGAKESGLRGVAVYSDPDAGSLHVENADQACTSGTTLADTYLNGDAIIEAPRSTGAKAFIQVLDSFLSGLILQMRSRLQV
ncbi:MAG: hypothetical protein Ct9H90mP14_3210 [Methanobacteriota archaeon]|nr:MAG: hypothetical protein Ct9H90mP14_3210 [Euryarchaeota archaeon]